MAGLIATCSRARRTASIHVAFKRCKGSLYVASVTSNLETASMAYSANLTAHKADLYGKHGTFSYDDDNIAPILSLLDLEQGEHVLDVGCGDGYLTDKLVPLVGDQGRVIGTDSNAGMVGLPVYT